MNLHTLGMTGLAAAQARLATTGHNIANADTEGYSRQSVRVSTAGGQGTSHGFFGRGVQIDAVTRSYDSFLYRRLTSAQTTGAALVAHGQQLGQIDSVLADRDVGVTPALLHFFDALDAVASSPADPAARQDLIGRSGSLATQMNELSRFLERQAEDVNTQIGTTVASVNSYVERIAELNRQIAAARASSNQQPPNDLYDQRDQLVAELNQLVDVRVVAQDDKYSLTVGKGQVLLAGDTVFPLQAVTSAADPKRVALAVTVPTATPGVTQPLELQDSVITGGSLGGLLQFRSTSLVPLQNDLGKMAVGLAQAFNALHRQGVDLNGDAGEDFFALASARGVPHARNTGDGSIQIDYADINAMTGDDYQVSFDGSQYTVTRLPANTEVWRGAMPAVIDGLELNLTGAAQAGDTWLLQPTRNAASQLHVAITDPARVAAADAKGGTANGEIALQLAKLREQKIMGGGTVSLSEAYSQLVSKGAVQTQSIADAARAQANLIALSYQAQQQVSGVNLNEEYVNIERYQEQFRAAAQVIDAGTRMFDTLLGLRQ